VCIREKRKLRKVEKRREKERKRGNKIERGRENKQEREREKERSAGLAMCHWHMLRSFHITFTTRHFAAENLGPFELHFHKNIEHQHPRTGIALKNITSSPEAIQFVDHSMLMQQESQQCI